MNEAGQYRSDRVNTATRSLRAARSHGRGSPDRLFELPRLIAFLSSPAGLQTHANAFVENMKYKTGRYDELVTEAGDDVSKNLTVARLQMTDLKRVSGVSGEHDNWHIFESVSERYREARDRMAIFESLRERAKGRLRWMEHNADAPRHLRDELVAALGALTNFTSHAHVVSSVVDLVCAFLKDPRLFRRRLVNFVLAGTAGTGKTTLAATIGNVFAKAGIFVGDRLVTAGRAELVGQYEGQTVARTRSFLTSNLDTGVIFVDEAYAITPWQQGKPEGYGSEAATAMVEFMTRYQGLYCLIVAGYEKEITRYFLPCNEGLSRRFPYKFVLTDSSPEYLVHVFQRQLMMQQGIPVPDGDESVLVSETYFSAEAWEYLKSVVRESLRGQTFVAEEFDAATNKTHRRVKVFVPTYEYMHLVFENQAGSMAALAEESITTLIKHIPFSSSRRSFAHSSGRPEIHMHGREILRSIIRQRILNVAMSMAQEFLKDFSTLEQALGVVSPVDALS